MSADRIDVLAVMDADARHAAPHRRLIGENVTERAAESAAARAAVAELIAADREYDAAFAVDCPSPAPAAVVARRIAATERRAAALARVGGAA